MEDKTRGPEHLRPHHFKKGHKGIPAKRPPVRGGLARTTRTLIGDDGGPLVELWWSIANDPMRRDADRLEASRLLADRGWGKAANFVAQEGDPLGLEDAEEAAEEFSRRLARLAAVPDQGADAPGGGERSADAGRSELPRIAPLDVEPVGEAESTGAGG
jgi:hypothetical protein